MKRCISLFFLFLLLAGCSETATTQGQSAEYTIGVLLKGMDSPHWMDVRSGINDAARTLGVNILLLYPAQENAVQAQEHMFRDLVTRKPDAILFAPCNSRNCATLAAQAAQNDIPLFTIDTAAEDTDLPYIGADNERMGRMAATRLAGLAKREGALVVIAGVETQSSHTARVEGFQLALQGYNQITVAGIYHADSDFQQAMECMERIMQEHPQVKGVFCTSAVMALGALEQIRSGAYDNPPNIVGVDTQDDAIAALRVGTLDGLVTQDGYECGYTAIEYVVAALHGATLPDAVYIDTSLQTPDTVESFLQERKIRKEGQYDESLTGG